jgi:predicted metal-dependent peptidase
LGTFGVDRHWRIYYDPDVAERMQVMTLAAVIYHELLHLLRDHAGRKWGDWSCELWNLAADAEINDGLREERLKLPPDAVYPESFGGSPGRLAEEYYDLMRDTLGPERQTSDTRGNQVPQECGSRCRLGEGSGVTAIAEPWELPADVDAEAPGVGVAEASIIRDRVARAVAQSAKVCGNVPGHLQRWAGIELRPQVDWRRELSSALRTALRTVAGAVDYSYQRPARRQAISENVLLPSLVRPDPQVAIVVDTSGSMGSQELSLAVTEAVQVLRLVGRTRGVQVLAVDAAVQVCETVSRMDQIDLLGGGGTDMAAGINAAASLHPRPEVLLVLTDGATPWPDRPPAGMRVIVGLIGNAGSTAPQWARTVRIAQTGGAPWNR